MIIVLQIIDKQADWELLDSKEINGYTILKYKTKLDTCDDEDFPIKKETNYLIFAWNDNDPKTGNNDWKYHGPSNRRTTAAYLFNRNNNFHDYKAIKADKNIFEIEMKVNKVI